MTFTLMSMAFDLHTHSTCSDGTQPPAEVVRLAAEAGLEGLALTDHDTTAGWDEAISVAQRHSISLVVGMELSCVTDEGISVHVLSYLHDPQHAGLSAEIARAREARIIRAQEMTARIARDYPDLSWELVLKHTHDDATVGRPHLADALVDIGVVPDRSAAFTSLLSSDSSYYVPHYAPDPALGVELIKEAGGVAVFAHPMAAKRGRTVSDRTFTEMIEAGLDGVEVDHRDNSAKGRDKLRQLARKYGLLTTGSSDFHGNGKPNRLGEYTTAVETVKALEPRASSGLQVLWHTD